MSQEEDQEGGLPGGRPQIKLSLKTKCGHEKVEVQKTRNGTKKKGRTNCPAQNITTGKKKKKKSRIFPLTEPDKAAEKKESTSKME